jgi:hypothetical protein
LKSVKMLLKTKSRSETSLSDFLTECSGRVIALAALLVPLLCLL